MNKKRIVLCFTVLCMSLGLVFTIDSSKSKAENYFPIDKIKAENNAQKFLNSINDDERYKLNTKFNKIYVEENNDFKTKRIVMENEQTQVQLDEHGSVVYILNKSETSKPLNKFVNFNRLSDDILMQKAKQIADQLSKDNKIIVLSQDLNNNFRTYKWARASNGYKYDFDFIIVTLDSSNGELAGSSKQFISSEPKINIRITDKEAYEIAYKNMCQFKDFTMGNLLNSELQIINPNYKWTDHFTTDFKPNARLAYSLTYKMLKPYDGKLIVWIDAENGAVLGGSMTR